MNTEALFNCGCPKCRRRTRLALPLLGETVRCQHCSHVFLAEDESVLSATSTPPGSDPFAESVSRETFFDISRRLIIG